MKKVLVLVFSTVGSGLGWWIGAKVGIMTAFIVSMIGLGIGIWAGARATERIGDS